MTPLMEQYLRLKAKHPHAMLLFRCGDFYEMFFEDAKEASSILGIALTSRSKDGGIPMAGVPCHAVESYVRRLLEAGKRVALAEQLTDPKDSPGLVERDVVEVVTPGTITEWSMLPERAPNYLAALAIDGGAPPADGGAPRLLGLAWLEASTGRFAAEDLAPDSLAEELSRIEPAEVLVPDGPDGEGLARALAGRVSTPYPGYAFDRASARRALLEHFGVATLEGFDCETLGPGLGAAGALLRYLGETRRASLRSIVRLERYRREKTLVLDAATRRALEIVETTRTRERRGSLLGAVDRTKTAMGARCLREWLQAPLVDLASISARQDAVGELARRKEALASIAAALSRIQDLERLAARVAALRATPRDLVALANSLERVPEVRAAIEPLDSALVAELRAALDPCAELRTRIQATLVPDPPPSASEGGLIREGVAPELDRLRALAREGKDWLARFEHEEQQRTGIPSLKVGHNRVFGYYIEVTHTHRAKVPPNYVRRQTLKNAERYVTEALEAHEREVEQARSRAQSLERELYEGLRAEVAREAGRLTSLARALAELDSLAGFASLAIERLYVRPRVTDGELLVIREGRHPVLEQTLTDEPFVPNDISLGEDGVRIAVVTGPNMAGKSTFCRQVALMVLLAQTGSFVPAADAEIGLCDRIFARTGAADEIARGLSTFMVEMTETANILHNATRRSLVVLDEVGRGTSTFDGVSLAFAITEFLAEQIGARTLFATHYHELTELAKVDPRVKNLNVAVREWGDEIVFLRKIVDGASDKSYGLHVARLAGVPRKVVERASEILADLERLALDGTGRPRLALAASATPRGDVAAPAPGGGPEPGARPARGGPSEAPRGPPRRRERQLGLFATEEEKLVQSLLGLDLATLTPLGALNLLARWQERIREARGP